MRQSSTLRYATRIGLSFFSAALMLLPGGQAMAATSQITQVVVTTAPQEIESGVMSQRITLQLRNAAGERELLDSELSGTRIAVATSSASGAFFDTATASRSAVDFPFKAGSANRSLYYKDTEPGRHSLSFRVYGGGFSPDKEVAASQLITITPVSSEGGDGVEPDPVVNPGDDGSSNDEEDSNTKPPILEPIMKLDPLVSHSAGGTLTVKGSIEHIPEEISLRLLLLNIDGVEVSRKAITSRGSDIELGNISLPATLTPGKYTVRVEAIRPTVDSDEVAYAVETVVQVTSVAPDQEPVTPPKPEEPVPPVDSTPPAAPVVYEPLDITMKPLATVATASLPVAGALKSVASTATPSSSIAAVVRSAVTNSQPTSRSAELDDRVTPEKSIELKTEDSKDEKGVALQSSQQGWRIFGTPWYWWGVGAATLYGGWLGVRRLLSSDA